MGVSAVARLAQAWHNGRAGGCQWSAHTLSQLKLIANQSASQPVLCALSAAPTCPPATLPTPAAPSPLLLQMVAGLRLNNSSAWAAFDKMEEKVMAMEAEAESAGLLATPDNLEAQFARLEGGCAHIWMRGGGVAWERAGGCTEGGCWPGNLRFCMPSVVMCSVCQWACC